VLCVSLDTTVDGAKPSECPAHPFGPVSATAAVGEGDVRLDPLRAGRCPDGNRVGASPGRAHHEGARRAPHGRLSVWGKPKKRQHKAASDEAAISGPARHEI